jgi:DivIVA domain-containing protein
VSGEAAPLPFPQTSGREKGYDPVTVDAFLARAREAFEIPDAVVPGSAAQETGPQELSPLTSADIRRTAFPLVKRGYRIPAVDAAMGRIEDAFAAREREQALSVAGARAWVGSSRRLAQEVLDRLSRPQRQRFRRVGALRYGYRIDEVDVVADRVARYLASGESLTVEQVRTVAFRMQRNGYDEVQVDAVLDAVIEVMLAVR